MIHFGFDSVINLLLLAAAGIVAWTYKIPQIKSEAAREWRSLAEARDERIQDLASNVEENTLTIKTLTEDNSHLRGRIDEISKQKDVAPLLTAFQLHESAAIERHERLLQTLIKIGHEQAEAFASAPPAHAV